MLSIFAASALIAEAGLSFLGYGVQPPDTSWGAMMGRDSWAYMVSAPSLLVVPSLCLVVTVLAMNMLGDALSEHLDPRLRGRT